METLTITDLIPQRPPILLVDSLTEADDSHAVTEATVKADCILVCGDLLTEAGITEHMAQSASAHAGYMARLGGATTAPIGYIGEVKRFRLHRQPRVGERLQTRIDLGPTVAGVTIVTATTTCEGEPVAEATLKIFIDDNA